MADPPFTFTFTSPVGVGPRPAFLTATLKLTVPPSAAGLGDTKNVVVVGVPAWAVVDDTSAARTNSAVPNTIASPAGIAPRARSFPRHPIEAPRYVHQIPANFTMWRPR